MGGTQEGLSVCITDDVLHMRDDVEVPGVYSIYHNGPRGEMILLLYWRI